MKKVTVQFTFDEEKLEALKVFLDEKGKTLDEELTDLVGSLYERIVPQKVQFFLEKKTGSNSGKTKHRAENKPV